MMRSQKIAPDILNKGVHFNVGMIELRAAPNHNGGLVFKPVYSQFARKNPGSLDAAIKQANESLNSPEFRAWLMKHAEKGFEMAQSTGNPKALEFKFLLHALRRFK